MTKTYDQARSFCDTLYPGAYLVAIETHTEKVFLESNTVVAPCKKLLNDYNITRYG